MRRLAPFTTPIDLASAASSLGLPPATSAYVAAWNDVQMGCVPEFDFEIWANEAIAVTSAVLYGGRLQAHVIADDTFVGEADDDNGTAAAHAYLTGDGPLYVSNAGGALPAPLEAGTPYWAIKTGDNTLKFAASLEDALAGTAIDLTTDGSGTNTISDSADTKRVQWSTHDGLLGLAGDGAIALAAGQGYSQRIPHSPRVVAYALVATLDTGAVSASISPIQDR